MRLIKINTDHYIICDDSEIKDGDWYWNDLDKAIRVGNTINHPYHKKITHSTLEGASEDYEKYGFKGLPKAISLQEVKELIEVDVEKLFVAKYNPRDLDLPIDGYFRKGWETGYNQAIEDNKEKKYTEAQMRECWRASERFDRPYNEGYAPNLEEFIQSLQPKTSWEVEIVDGKLKLI